MTLGPGKRRQGRWRLRVLGLLLLVLLALSWLGAYAGRKAWARHYYQLAQQALERLDFDQARADLVLCLQICPDDVETHFLAARTARRGATVAPGPEDWYNDAERHLSEYERLGGDGQAVRLERALRQAQQGELASVEGYLLSCLGQEHPDTPFILEALVQGYMRSHEILRALRCASLLVQHQPENPQAWFWRGLISDLRFARHLAIADYRRVLELDPERDQARLRLAEDLIQLNQFQEAEAHLQRLRERQPGNAETLLGLAHCWRTQGRLPEARRLLEVLLDQQPQDGRVLLEVGRVELGLGLLARAERSLRLAIAKAPHEAQAYYSLYLCLQQLGREGEAKGYLQAFERIDADWKRLKVIMQQIVAAPRDPCLRREAGVLLLRNGQEEQGLGWLTSALRIDPAHSASHQALAQYYAKKGQPARAAQHRRQALPGQLRQLAICLAGIRP